MIGAALALVLAALVTQEPGAGADEAHALLADVRAWMKAAELPAPDDVAELRAVADELWTASHAPREAELLTLVRELGNLGHRLGGGGRHAEAHALVQWTGAHAEEAGDLDTQAWALDWLGQEAWVGGELDAAADELERAAEVDARRRAGTDQTRHLADVARIRLTQGRFDEARDAATRASAAAQASGSAAARRSAAEILDGIWFELGKHREALDLCLENLALESGAEAEPDEARVRLEILASDILADVGRLEAAVAHARTAHELALDPRLLRVAPLLHLEAKLSLGLLLGDLGHCDEALGVLDVATAEFERLGDRRGLGWAAKNRGFALFAAGRLAESLPAFETAWHAGAELGVPFLEGLGALGVAEALVLDESTADGSEPHRVEEALSTAERVAGALHERTLEWRCAALRGRILLARGEPAAALEPLRRAVELVERWRRRLGASGLVEHALRQRADPYRDAAFAAAKLGRFEEAARFASLLQARVLDELRARGSGPLPAQKPAIEALRERVARLTLAGHDTLPDHVDETALVRAEDELDAALVADELGARRTLASPDARLAPDELQRALAREGFDLALVYLVGAHETLVLRLDARGAAATQGRFLDVGEDRLTAWIRALREPIARLEEGALDLAHLGFDVPAARALYETLVRPLELPQGARVALIPDGVLAAIPFELFVTGGTSGALDLAHPFAHLAGLEYLGDEHTFVVLGSLARLLEPDSERAGETVILVPPEAVAPPGAAAEARTIAAALGGARVERDALATDVVRRVAGAARVHFAAHGRFDPERPAHGQLVLGGAGGGEGALESWQVAELDLAGVEVVLSACHSGRGAILAGAGLAGLLRGFFLAGARDVIASPWAVDDRVAARFMELFYGELAQGRASADALRAARLSLRAETDPRGFSLAHPVFWAAWSEYR